MRFGYFDPPYLGCGARYAEHHPDALIWDDPETHRQLIARASEQFPDGWAMSLSSTSLHTILPMCPADVRVMAWVKPFAVFKPNVNPAYAWEPVIVRGGRRRTREQATVRDWVSAAEPMPADKWELLAASTQILNRIRARQGAPYNEEGCSYVDENYFDELVEQCIAALAREHGRKPHDWVSANITLKRGLCGAKPEAFCRWLFEVLGMERDDELHDEFPGSGAVTRAWNAWRQQGLMFDASA